MCLKYSGLKWQNMSRPSEPKACIQMWRSKTKCQQEISKEINNLS